MINVNEDFLYAMQYRSDFREHAVVTFTDGSTLELTESSFTISNNSITDAANESSFPLGAAISRTIQIELMNDAEQFADYDFFGARIRFYMTFKCGVIEEDDGRLLDPSGNELLDPAGNVIEAYAAEPYTAKIELGTFTVVTPETYGETVIITANDDMYKADVAYSTSLVFPATLAEMFRDCCSACNLPYATSVFANSTFRVTNAPTGDYTQRQVLGFIAMLAGGNVRVNANGYVEIKSYSFDFTQKHHALKAWSTLKMDTRDTTITGIQTTTSTDNADTTYMIGADGYVLTVENPLLEGNEDAGLNAISAKLLNVKFRIFDGEHIANPLIEFMDLCEITDRKGNVYQSVITDVCFNFFGKTTLKNSAASGVENASKYSGSSTSVLVQAKKLVAQEKTDREVAIDALNRTLENAAGMYETDVALPDGSTIRYIHDKNTLAASLNVIKITSDAIGISNDGGKTYPYGLTLNGNTILAIIQAEGLNADWITSGSINANLITSGIINADLIKTGTINANLIKAGSMSAERITSGKIVSENGKAYFDLDNNILACSKLVDSASTSSTPMMAELKTVNNGNGVPTYGLAVYQSGYAEKGMVLSANATSCGLNTGSRFSLIGIGEIYANTVFTSGASATIQLAENQIYMLSKNSSGASASAGLYPGNTSWIRSGGDIELTTQSNNGKVSVYGNLWVYRNITCSGTKSRIAETESYNSRLFYCYEMPTPYFGDVGSGKTDASGDCYVDIDSIFGETVSADIRYFVFLQKEGEGDIWVAKKTPQYFVVHGTPNLPFSWELKARQRGFETLRMDDDTVDTSISGEIDYMEDAAKMVEDFYSKLEEL